MSNFYSVNATKGLATTSGSIFSRMVDGNEVNSPIRWLHDTYEATTVSGQSTITFGKLPGSSWVVGGFVSFDTCSGTNVMVGTSADEDKFSSSASLTSDGTVTLYPVYVSLADFLMITVVSGTQPYTGSIEVSLLYVM